MNKTKIIDINTAKFNPFGASSEELIAIALDEAGLIKQTTTLNDLNARNICISYYNKRNNYRELTKLGNLLIKKNLITPEELQKALDYQNLNPDHKIGDILLELNLCTECAIQQSMTTQAQVREDIKELDTFKDKILVIKDRLKNLLS